MRLTIKSARSRTAVVRNRRRNWYRLADFTLLIRCGLCWKRAGPSGAIALIQDFGSNREESLPTQHDRLTTNSAAAIWPPYRAAVSTTGADGGRHIQRSFSDPAHRREYRKQSTVDGPGLRDTAFRVEHKTRTGMEPLNSYSSAQQRACRLLKRDFKGTKFLRAQFG